MKLWSRVCLLVLAVAAMSRGQRATSDSPRDKESEGSSSPSTQSPTSGFLNRTEMNGTRSTPPDPKTHMSTTVNTTLGEPRKTDADDRSSTFRATEQGAGRTSAPPPTAVVAVTDGAAVGRTTVPMATAATSPMPVTIEDRSSLSWGYVILVLIILVIIALCVILYFLRRTSRTYSFDLHRPNPNVNQFSEPTGTFEPVYLDDLDQPAPKDQVTISEQPVANGTSLQSEEKAGNGENAAQESPDANGPETSPTGDSGASGGDDPADKTSDPSSCTNLFFDDTGETQQNENNNNPSVCSSDPFVDVNLDEPAWCDQLLAAPEAASSVLPFSPFSFSSTSSTSSS